MSKNQKNTIWYDLFKKQPTLLNYMPNDQGSLNITSEWAQEYCIAISNQSIEYIMNNQRFNFDISPT